MSFLEAAVLVLQQAGHPLRYEEIVKRALEKGLIQTNGKTPAATMNARISVEISTEGAAARFQRTAPGTYYLRDSNASALPAQQPSMIKPIQVPHPLPNDGMSFADAAEHLLDKLAHRKPMHYTMIAKLAQENGWLRTEGKTPEATLAAVISQENSKRRARGEEPRFVAHGKGLYGLSGWQRGGSSLVNEIDQRNKNVREELHKHLFTMHPKSFEAIVGRLLVALGFDKVEITSYHKDGGIDVRGELVVGDVIRTKMAVQVKRWKHNIQTPTVQQLRGSLGAHEQGLIITTSDFSEGARDEASRLDTAPVGLMNGDELVGLLVEKGIGVHKEARELLELALDDANGDSSEER